MAIANIVHSGFGFRCTATDTALPLTLGLDGSAVMERLIGLPDGWLVDASEPEVSVPGVQVRSRDLLMNDPRRAQELAAAAYALALELR